MNVTAVDLFAGAGGLSEGLLEAGARVVLAVEARADAAATYEANHPNTSVLCEAIELAWRRPDEIQPPDILAGGPPCQGWSTLGHRGSDVRRARHNAGIALFLEQVQAMMPKAVILENVRGLAVADGGRQVQRIEARLRSLGYLPTTRLVRACEHGVPQLRHRLFVVAVRGDLGFSYKFPRPSRRPPLTLIEAISDLPELAPGESASTYRCAPINAFQRKMRRGAGRTLTLHGAPAHPDHLLELLAALPKEGGSVRDLPARLRPSSGFHNTYARLRSDEPAAAVTSSIGRVSSGRHVHPWQDRALTAREAARLQTFRDAYEWEGGRWSIYEQIGNAVPPLLAAAIARPLVTALEGSGVKQAA